MKKLLVTLLAAVVALSAIAVAPASAVQMEADQTFGRISEYKAFLDTYQGAVDAIAVGTYNLEKRVNIASYKIPYSQENARKLFAVVQHTHPELFFVSNSFSYGGTYDWSLGDYVISYLNLHWGKITNGAEETYTDNQVRQMQTEFRTRAQWYLDKVKDGMSDFDKALVLHDALALNAEYLITGEIYDLMVNGKGKCYGYSECYSYLLAQVGINSEIIESDSMNHQWNKVEVGGKYYHVDVTWDDPVYDKPGLVDHTFFLLSDSAIENMDGNDRHYSYVTDYPSTDTRYDNANFHKITSQFCYVGNDVYAVDNNSTSSSETGKSLLLYNAATDGFAVVESFSDVRWSAGNGYLWTNNYMSLEAYDGYLYMNTPSKVLVYDPETGELADFAENTFGQDFYGLRVMDGKVYSVLADNPNVTGTLQYVGDCLTRPVVPEDMYVVAGDVVDLFGAMWDASNTDNQMAESGGVYIKTYTVTQAYDVVQLRVVKNGSEWYGNAEGDHIAFSLTGAGTFTVAFDPAANEVSVTGETVRFPFDFGNIVSVYGGSDSWTFAENMEMTERDVYEIEFTAVPQGVARQLTFELYGNPNLTFGGTFTAGGEAANAVFNSAPAAFDTPWHSQTVKVQMDLRNFNPFTYAGATFTVTIIPDPLTGDLNGDDAMTIEDATCLQQYLSEYITLTEEQLALADANGDGKVNIKDVTYLQRQVAELI